MKNQKEYWDAAAPAKTFTTEFQRGPFEALVPKCARILDVGCGYGRTLCELKECGYTDLHGTDFSEVMLERGRKLLPECDLRASSGNRLPFPDASFDAVILLAVLTCIASDAEQTALIAEIHRVLRPEGIIYINDFLLNDDPRNRDRYDAAAVRFAGTFPYGVFELPEGAVLRHQTRNSVEKLLQPFETLRFEEITFRTMNGHTSRGFYFFGKNFHG